MFDIVSYLIVELAKFFVIVVPVALCFDIIKSMLWGQK